MKQSIRTPRRLLLYFAVMALVCCFLCIGLNLKRSADANIQNVLDCFRVTAQPSFQAWIGPDARRSDPRHSVGYFPCWAEGYDLDALASLPGVRDIQVRNQFGAYLHYAGDANLYYERNHMLGRVYTNCDVVIFRLRLSHPITMKETTGPPVSVPAEVLWSAVGNDSVGNVKFYSTFFSRYQGLTLEPGKTYIAMVPGESYDPYHAPLAYSVTKTGAIRMREGVVGQPLHPHIMEYSDGFWDTDAGAWYQQTAQACEMDVHSFTAVTTGDLEHHPAWESGGVRLRKGRTFAPEEYAEGAKVCMISENVADRLKLQVGDTLDFSFYESAYAFNGTTDGQDSSYVPSVFGVDPKTDLDDRPLDHFFDQGTFEIVGIFGGKLTRSELLDETYRFDEGMTYTTILFPERSVQNQPAPKLSPYNTTITLEPLMVRQFLAAAQTAGLTEPQEDGYQLGLTVNDHGLSDMTDGLEFLRQVGGLMLLVSAVTAIFTVAALAVLHLLQSKKQIAVLRSIGVRRGQTVVCIAAGLLAACLLGAVLGAFVGQGLTVRVGENILRAANEDAVDGSFSAMLSRKDKDEAPEVQVTGDPAVTAVTVGLVFITLSALLCGLTAAEAQKPPLLTLGTKE